MSCRVIFMVIILMVVSCQSKKTPKSEKLFQEKLSERIETMKRLSMEECRKKVVVDANRHVDTMMPVWYNEILLRDSLFPSRPERPLTESEDTLRLDSQILEPLFNLPDSADSTSNNR